MTDQNADTAKMTYNYHTHTHRCHHASGTEQEYIERALQNGITQMGFSEHAPFAFPDGYESIFRLPLAQVSEYLDTVGALRETYRSRMKIAIGFEMEYYPSHFEKMLKTAVESGAEYLLLGQHFLYEEYPNGKPSIAPTDNVCDLQNYVSHIVAGIESGVFTYVAHPDIVNFVGDAAVYREEMRKICEASKRCDVPLEINFYGIRDNRNYPNETFWELAGQVGAPVTFGFDAHTVDSAYDGESLQTAQQLVERYRLRYIGAPKLVPITSERGGGEI